MTAIAGEAAGLDSPRLAALLLASGPVLFFVAGIVTPSGLYQAPEDAARLGIIDAQWLRFLAAQALWVLWLAVPAAGLVLLSRHLVGPTAWLPIVAAALAVAGAVAGVAFVALQTADPQRFWLDGEGTWASALGAWLLVASAGLFGIAMLTAGGWTVAGVAMAGAAGVGAVALVLSAPAFFVTALLEIAAVAPAFVLWRGG